LISAPGLFDDLAQHLSICGTPAEYFAQAREAKRMMRLLVSRLIRPGT